MLPRPRFCFLSTSAVWKCGSLGVQTMMRKAEPIFYETGVPAMCELRSLYSVDFVQR